MGAVPDRAVPDARKGNWVDSRAPETLRPFLRLARIDRPIGWWLLLLPCLWSAALVAGVRGSYGPDLLDCLLFWIGAVAMRGAGSTYNDIIDRELDARVARTRTRPIASGDVSVRAAALFCALQCAVGLAVLLSFNRFAIGLGFLSILPVLVYPFMKRVTSWPQAVLGLAFAWGALMGWVTATGRLDAPAFFLYGAAIAWTLGYDTIYAIQDIEDDALAGIRSTARLFGSKTPVAIGIFYIVAGILALLAVFSAQAGLLAYAGVAGFFLHLMGQALRVSLDDGARALRLFQSNRNAGLILFAGLALDAAVRHVLPHFGG